MYFIGVDNGAERTRTVVLNLESATLVAQSEKSHSDVAGLPGGYREQDPTDWIHAVDHTVRDCLSQLGEGRRRVAGLGVSGQGDGLVCLDAENRVVRPAKVAADQSSAPQCRELTLAFGGAPGLIELCGNPLRPAQMAPRISWLKQNEPYHFKRVASFLSPHDFINYWLGGVKRSEFGEASESGFLEVRSRAWCRELIDHIDPGLNELLPPVRSSREAVGVLRGELARTWELSEGVLLSAGGAFDMMTALGAGAATCGAVSICTDQPATLCAVSDRPLIDPRGEVAACCDATDRWMQVARRVEAAAGAEHLRAHYGWDVHQLDAVLAAGEPGAQGLLVLPGQRGSGRASATLRHGAMLGIEAGNFTPVNVVRATMEAFAMEIGHALRRMIELGFEPTDVRLAGRTATHPAWRQLLADVLGLPVLTARRECCPALGAALQAAVTFFHQSGEDLSYAEMTSYAALPEERTLCAPNPSRHGLYRELMERHAQLADYLREDPFA